MATLTQTQQSDKYWLCSIDYCWLWGHRDEVRVASPHSALQGSHPDADLSVTARGFPPSS